MRNASDINIKARRQYDQLTRTNKITLMTSNIIVEQLLIVNGQLITMLKRQRMNTFDKMKSACFEIDFENEIM